jgi:hypothetical protein
MPRHALGNLDAVRLDEAKLREMEMQDDVLDVVKHALDVLRVGRDGEVRVQPLVLGRDGNRLEPVLDVSLRLVQVRAPCRSRKHMGMYGACISQSGPPPA